MSKPRLVELKNATLKYLKQWKKAGNATGVFECPRCEKENETTKPTAPGETWTTSCTCYECGALLFKSAKFNEVTVTKIGD